MANFFNRPHIAADFREEAKSYCSLDADKLAVIYLVYFAISIVICALDAFTGKTSVVDGVEYQNTWLSSGFTLLCSGPFAISFAYIAKNVHKGIEPRIENLLEGFKDFGRALVIYLLQSIFTLLWALLLIIPGIIKSISYSMAFYVAMDNKELSAKECIKESQRLMDGCKWQYFCLMLSYIGWIILSCLTFGILFLWVLPRMQQASYLFYLDISGKGLEEERQAKLFDELEKKKSQINSDFETSDTE